MTNDVFGGKTNTEVLRRSINIVIDDKNRLLHVFCILLLVNWIGAVFSGFKYSWLVFIFGPFLSVGILLSNIFEVENKFHTFVYISLINSIAFTTVIGIIGTLINDSNYSQWFIVYIFSILYIIILIVSFTKKSNLNVDSLYDVNMSNIKYTLLGILTLSICYMSAQIMANGGTVYLNHLSYSFLGVLMIYSVYHEMDDYNTTIIVLIIGVGLIWLRAFSTHDLFAGDGRHAVRLAQLMLESGISLGADGSRTSSMLSVRYFLPSFSLLMDKDVMFISQYLLPTLAGVSLIGVFSLTCNWLTSRDALIAAFILGTKTMFFTALIINFRTTLAFLMLVAFFIMFMNNNRRQYILSLVFLIGVIGFHDTVGIFLISLLTIYLIISYINIFIIEGVVEKPRRIFLFGISIGTYYILFLETKSFEGIILIVSYTLLTYVSGNNLDLRQDTASQSENISGSIAGTLFIASSAIEIILAALATILIMGCWLFRNPAASYLKGFSTSLSFENLIVSNSILFGILILVPRLGVHRVFLYSSPFLVGLIPLSIRQLEKIKLRYHIGRSLNWNFLTRAILTVILIFGFINHVGFIFLITDANGTEGPHIGAKEVDNYYFEKADVEAKYWISEYFNQDTAILADYYGRNLLHSHPEIRSHDTLPADKHPQELDSCILFRSGNEKNKEFYINDPDKRLLKYEDKLITDMQLIYSSGNAKITCPP